MYYGLSYEEFQEKTDRELYRIDEYKKKCILTDKHIEALQYNAYLSAHCKNYRYKSTAEIFGFVEFKLTPMLRNKMRFMLKNYLK